MWVVDFPYDFNKSKSIDKAANLALIYMLRVLINAIITNKRNDSYDVTLTYILALYL